MCGICGKIDKFGVEEQEIRQVMKSLAHRGPDEDGLYIEKKIGIGHNRLSIIDLNNGQQPMSNEDGTVWITFNGEIYNYKELTNELEQNHIIRTKSDTEVILHLYEEKGESTVKYLRGMFAFAIYDKNKNTLFLARDHLGQKPLYYYHENGSFGFASEIKALLELKPELREIDPTALYEYLTLRIITPPRSMFKKVRKLDPGHYLTFKNGNIRIQRYWHLSYQPKMKGSFQDIINALEEQITDTIRYHLISDVPVGAFLSGGMDSSLIVAMMAKMAETPPQTFCGNVPYLNYSEAPYSRMVAEKYKTQHHELTISPSLMQTLPTLVWHLDEPSDPLSVCMYHLSKLTKEHVKVVLGGDGGDELFGGYDRYYGNVLVSFYALISEKLRSKIIEKLIKKIPEGFWYRSLSHRLRWIHQMAYYKNGDRYANSLSYFYFSDDFKKDLYTNKFMKSVKYFDPKSGIKDFFESDNAHDIIDKMLYTDSMTRMPDHPNMILDRMTMAHGLEARSPFLDHKLAEFCATIPANFKVKGTKRRYIQENLAKKYLPEPLFRKQKQGFSSALTYMLADEFKKLYRVFLSDSILVRNGYIRQSCVNRIIAEHLGKKVDHGNRLWLLCNAEVWYRMYIEKQSKDDISEFINTA